MRNLLLLWAICCTYVAAAQIQSPSEFLGYELGSHFSYHHRIVDYYEYVAAQSPKVQLIEYGTTTERRPMVTAIVTSEKNLKNIDQLRQNNLKGAGLLEGNINGKQLPIVWLSYNIHGDEAVSSEAAMAVLHTLATDNSKNAWLDEVIVILDPCENPDGRDRYANWYNQVMQHPTNPSEDGMEHNQPWPGGRYNHYLFDLNRDWAWQTQKESRQRIQHYQKWMPHVHVDLHEQGVNSPYFFAPAAEPVHNAITKWQDEFENKVGDSNTKYFDEKGWLYFTHEVFDLLYPSYGDTWPTFNGAIGFTYEQGGSRRAGVKVMMENGNYLTLNDRIDHHYTTSLSTIETAYNNRQQLVKEFNTYFNESAENGYGEYKTYVIKGGNNPKKLEALMDLLTKQNITFGTPKTAGRGVNGFDYMNNSKGSTTLESNDLIISTYQPLGRYVNVLFEPETFVQDSLTYDMTAWAVPYIFELESYAISGKVETKEIAAPTLDKYTATSKIPYAVLAEWNDVKDVKFLAQLFKAGLKVRYSENPFTINGKTYDRGTLIITREDNKNYNGRYDEKAMAIAYDLGLEADAVTSGRVSMGSDFGSSTIRYIEPPKIALIGGDGISPLAYGEVWHYFEEEIDYPVTTIHTNYARYVDLEDYDVVILVSSNNGDLKMDDFVEFARNGGKVIAIEGGVRAFSSSKKTTLGNSTKGRNGNGHGGDLQKIYAEADRQSASYLVAGSIYKVHIDNTHPLGMGTNGQVHLIKRNSSVLPMLNTGQWNVGVFRNDSHVAGFVGHQLKQEIPNSLAFGVERKGRGNIVYFSDSPIFRGFWHSGKLLLGNAIFLVGN